MKALCLLSTASNQQIHSAGDAGTAQDSSWRANVRAYNPVLLSARKQNLK